MDLLERYLQAIGRYLPPTTRQDVLAELRANLQAQMDDRAEELNHSLTETDVADILLSHGKPELVAARYLPQRSLIGPAIFPFYLLALRRALPFVLLVYAIATAARFIWLPFGLSMAGVLGKAAIHLIPTLLTFWAVVTLLFTIIDFVYSRYDTKWNEWDPLKLPSVKAAADEAKPRSLAMRIIDLVVHCLWMLFVFILPRHLFLILGPGIFYLDKLSVTFAPVWQTFYALLIVLLFVQLVGKILALRNGAQRWKIPIELLTKLIGIAGLAILATAKTYLIPINASTNIQKLSAINHSLNLSFRIVLFIAIVGLLADVWKHLSHSLPTKRLAF